MVRKYKTEQDYQSTDNSLRKVPKNNIKKRTEKKYLSKLVIILNSFS